MPQALSAAIILDNDGQGKRPLSNKQNVNVGFGDIVPMRINNLSWKEVAQLLWQF